MTHTMPKHPTVRIDGATEEQMQVFEKRRKQLGDTLISAMMENMILTIKYKTSGNCTVTVCYEKNGAVMNCGISNR